MVVEQFLSQSTQRARRGGKGAGHAKGVSPE